MRYPRSLLQVNARVPAAGKWRGIDSAQMLRMQRAINGIGHRAVLADPGFREALAGHGYTVDPAGEIAQLAAAVPAMSKRSAQVTANIQRYERQWRTENPGQVPGPGLLRAWDERAWADNREAKKNHPTRGTDCEQAWINELRGLGVDVDAHLAAGPVPVGGVLVGAVDRAEAAGPGHQSVGCRRPRPVVFHDKWFCRTFREARRVGAWCSWAVAGECCCRVLLPHLSPVIIDSIDGGDRAVVIAAHPRARGSRCRRCGRVSTRVHSRVDLRIIWHVSFALNGTKSERVSGPKKGR